MRSSSSGAYVKFTRRCNHDAEPIESYSTTRLEDRPDAQGMGVYMHPLVCPVCSRPWERGPVMQEVD